MLHWYNVFIVVSLTFSIIDWSSSITSAPYYWDGGEDYYDYDFYQQCQLAIQNRPPNLLCQSECTDSDTKNCSAGEICCPLQCGGICAPVFVFELDNYFPSYGPSSGSTNITIEGDFRNVRITRAYLKHQASNIIVDCSFPPSNIIEASEFVIITKPMDLIEVPFEIYIEIAAIVQYLQVDQLINTTFEYIYKEDPEITDIFPSSTFLRGGLKITAIGRNFDSVYAPVMYIDLERRRYDTKSVSFIKYQITRFLSMETYVYNSTVIIGISPEIDVNETVNQFLNLNESVWEPNRKRRQAPTSPSESDEDKLIINSDTIEFYVGFILDGTYTFDKREQVKVFINPIIHKFANIRKFDPDEENFIDIKGERLDLAARMSDYTIAIGDDKCEVIELLSNRIHCVPPNSEPRDKNGPMPGKPQVVVQVGYLRATVGHVDYVGQNITLYIIIGVVAGVAVVVILIAIVMCCYLARAKK